MAKRSNVLGPDGKVVEVFQSKDVPQHKYRITTITAADKGAGTDAHVEGYVFGQVTEGNFAWVLLGELDNRGNDREPGEINKYELTAPAVVKFHGAGLLVERNTVGTPSPTGWHWKVASLQVTNLDTGETVTEDRIGLIDVEGQICTSKQLGGPS